MMFEIGFWELVVVGLLALWALGPERLPAVARVCGRWLLRAKHSYQTIRNEFMTEFQRTSSSLQKESESLTPPKNEKHSIENKNL